VLEYCSVVWHHSLSKTQCESLEAIQRRAMCIIYPVIVGVPNNYFCIELYRNSISSLILINGFSGLFLTLPLAFFHYYLHKQIALLGQLPEQNVLHLQYFLWISNVVFTSFVCI